MMVNSNAIRVKGLITGMNFLWYHSLSFTPDQDKSGKKTCNKRDSKVNKDAFCNLTDGDIDFK